jgi:hypothetical protein
MEEEAEFNQNKIRIGKAEKGNVLQSILLPVSGVLILALRGIKVPGILILLSVIALGIAICIMTHMRGIAN